jgi:hypothetical protein
MINQIKIIMDDINHLYSSFSLRTLTTQTDTKKKQYKTVVKIYHRKYCCNLMGLKHHQIVKNNQ